MGIQNPGGTSSSNPIFNTNQLGRASGITAVTGVATTTGQSATFTPQPNRPINVDLDASAGPASFSVQLERSLNGGVTWHPLTIGGTQWAIYTTSVSETPWTEPESGAQYRLNFTAFVGLGAVVYRISH